MKFAGPLPDQLRQRYVDWKAQGFVDKAKRFEVLAAEGQAPEAMVISCCDSRVSATELFQANPGDFFTHRNIANLVPPFDPDGPHFGTFSAIEYAVTALKVPHIIVIGHSSCGGVRACYNMCEGTAPELERKDSFIGRWVDVLRPVYTRLPDETEPNRLRSMEQQGVVFSLENLMTFPFVAEAVSNGSLSLHGLWNDIGTGTVEFYDSESDAFRPM